jgi:hypothetical protein
MALMRRLLPACLLVLTGAPHLEALDPLRQVLLAWPEADPRAVELAREIGAGALFVPASPAPAGEFFEACRRAAVAPVAEIRGVNSMQELERRAREALAAGFSALAYNAWSEQAEVRRFVAARAGVPQFVYLRPEQADWDVAPAFAVLVEGLWPGIRPQDPTTASATALPWVDSNLWLYAWVRACFPNRPALAGYRPNEAAGVPKDRRLGYHTVEIALAEAMASGGNLVLTLPDRYREALLAGEAKARESWQSLARTSALLRREAARFEKPPGARVLVLAGTEEASGEVLNLLYRMNATPAVAAVQRAPAPDPGKHPVVVAVNLTPPAPVLERLWQFTQAGGTLLVSPDLTENGQWWKDRKLPAGREENGRTAYSVGKGKLIAYPEPVIDAYELALDVVAVLGWKERDLRLWNAETVVGLLRREGAAASLVLIDYGTRWQRDHDPDILVQLFGSFPRVTLRTPELAEPVTLAPRLRGRLTEFELRELRQFAILDLEAGTR